MSALNPDLVKLIHKLIDVNLSVVRTTEAVAALQEYLVHTFLVEMDDDDDGDGDGIVADAEEPTDEE